MNGINLKTMLGAFVIGSCILATIITFSYVGRAYTNAGRPSDISIETFPIGIAIAFGLANVLNVWLISTFNLPANFALIIGALLGLTFSLVGRFQLGLPQRIFGFTAANEYQVHLIAMVLYALIFRLIVQNLNIYLLY